MLWRLIEATPDVEHLVFSLSGSGALSGGLRSAGAILLNDYPKRPGLMQSVTALRKHAASRAPDVIQGWMSHGNLAAMAAWSAAPRARLFWNIRQSLTEKRLTKLSVRALMLVQAACSRLPCAILYNSMAGAQDHEKIGFSRRKRIVIPNGFNIDLFRPDTMARDAVRAELGLSGDQLAIGLIARYDPWKNHEGFFRMAACLAERHAHLVFVLAGKDVEWANPALAALVSDASLKGRVFLLGDRRDVPSINAALDIACNVSHGEGFPNAVGEAMACGIPCMVTPVGASAELVGACGLASKSTKDDDLIEAAEVMIRMPEAERRALGAAARERILAHFSIKAVAERYLSLYAKSLASEDASQGIAVDWS